MALDIIELDSNKILLVEDNIGKRRSIHLGMSPNNFSSINQAFEFGNEKQIPPIVIMQRNKDFESFKEMYFLLIRKEILKFANSNAFNLNLIEEIIKKYEFIVYEGNSRLEIFQKHNSLIKAYLVKSDSDLMDIPKEEQNPNVLSYRIKLVQEFISKCKEANITLSVFESFYFLFFHDGTQIICEKKHQENFFEKITKYERRKKPN